MTALPHGPQLSEDEQTFRWFARPLQWLRECGRRFGPTFTLRFRDMAPHIVFTDPEPIREIFAGDVTRFQAGEGNAILRPFLGANSLLLLDGEKYLRHRKRMLPAFSPALVRGLAPAIASLARNRIGAWPAGEPIALDAEMRALSLDVILRVVFGDDVATTEALRPGFLRLLEAVGFGAVAVEGGGGEAWRRYRDQLDELDVKLAGAIGARRLRPGDDALSSFLAPGGVDKGSGEPLSDAEARDELVTVLIAGHETVATTLAWAFARLLRSPRARRRLAVEIAGAEGDVDRWLAAPYLDAVVRETLRIDPVIPVVSRRLVEPTVLGGFRLPAGVHVVPCAYLAQRRPETFPNPETFRPERFLHRQFTPYEYFPFGGGVRRCLGMGLAQTEMKLVLATAFERWSFEPLAKDAPHPVRRSVAIGPSPGPRALCRPALPAAAGPRL